jgi:hypothetical protein
MQVRAEAGRMFLMMDVYKASPPNINSFLGSNSTPDKDFQCEGVIFIDTVYIKILVDILNIIKIVFIKQV